MIQISEHEWIIIRDELHGPAAIARSFNFNQEHWYRIVSWAPKSEDRYLFGWVRTLAMADMAVTFLAGELYTDLNRLTVERSDDVRLTDVILIDASSGHSWLVMPISRHRNQQ
jgi:hypothetical protein